MATSKPVVKVPPIVSIEPRGDSRYGQPGAYAEIDNSRMFGMFLDIRADGTLRGVLEVGGNIAPFQTCCGGLRGSAFRVDYRHFDSWYPAGSAIQTNHPTVESSWQYIRTHMSQFPAIHQCAGTDDARNWTTDQIREWGRAVLCAHVKTSMQHWRRTTLLCLDRGGGHTITTLASMKHIDDVHYSYHMMGPIFTRSGLRHAGAPMQPAVANFRGCATDIYRRGSTFAELRAYGSSMTQNINSGNMLWPITVIPKMKPTAQKGSGARLIRSLPNTMKFVAYDSPREMEALLNFYASPLFTLVAPTGLSHA